MIAKASALWNKISRNHLAADESENTLGNSVKLYQMIN